MKERGVYVRKDRIDQSRRNEIGMAIRRSVKENNELRKINVSFEVNKHLKYKRSLFLACFLDNKKYTTSV